MGKTESQLVSGQEIDGQGFSDQRLIEARLSDIVARRCDLSGWRLTSSDLKNLSLTDSRFNYCWSYHCNWQRLSLDHCLCAHGMYNDCLFDKFSTHTSFLTSSYFVKCRLNAAVSELSSFGLCVFENSQFIDSRMSEVTFIGSVWRDCEFRGASYNFVRFPSALFVNSRFIDCNLRKAIFRRATFINCRFESCQLPESVFHNARFTDTVFDNTDIHQAANLEGVQGLEL